MGARLTVRQQDLLVLILQKKSVTYRDQKIYSSRKFYDALAFLKRNGVVNPICVVCKHPIKDNHRNTCSGWKCQQRRDTTTREFELTLTGEILAHFLEGLK